MQQEQSAQSQYRCAKCGHDQATPGLREVKVTVGWQHCQFLCVAPTHMCQRCGDVVVFYEVHIGQFMDFVPGQQARGGRQQRATLQVVARKPDTEEPVPVARKPEDLPDPPPAREPFEPIGNTD